MQAPEKTVENTLKELRGRIVLSRLALFCERFTKAFWPFLTVCVVVAAVVLWGLGGILPMKAYLGILALGLLAGVVFFAFGLARFSWPTRLAAILRLDRRLDGHPLATILDTQSAGASDEASVALWNAHVAQMTKKARGAQVEKPDLKVSGNDPWALRLMALLFLFAGLLFGRPDTLDDIQGRLAGTTDVGINASFEGWVEPPRYTGLPALYLNDLKRDKLISVPIGSEVTLRIYGGEDTLVSQTVSSKQVELDPENPVQAVRFSMDQSGELSVALSQTNTSTWLFDLTDDSIPSVSVNGDITASAEGVMQLPFKANDDYGVQSGAATIALDLAAVDRVYGLAAKPDDMSEIVTDLPMPFRGGRDDFEDVIGQDFSQHPWVGQPVKITLSVEDGAGQFGTSDVIETALLGRRFFNPIAAALIEQRRDLLWSSKNVQRVEQVLKAVTYKPKDMFPNRTAFLMIRTAIRRLQYSGLSERDSVAELLWNAAVLIEDGSFGDARERLKRAQDRLSEAMKDGASEDEISKLMEELRQAMKDFMQEGARNAQQEPSDEPDQGERQEITQDQIAEMMDKIEELLREGQVAEAQQLLEQMRQMMKDLQFTQGDEGEGGEGQQSMEGLQDTLRQQQQLADDAFRQLQEQFNQNSGDPSQGQNLPGSEQGHSSDGQSQEGGENTPNTSGQQDLAQRQEALRKMLEEQRGELEGNAGGKSLQDAERAMDEAQKNFSGGNTEEALNNQADAMEALRQGMQEIGDGQQEGRDQASQQGDQQGRNSRSSQDPLGRDTGAEGGVANDGTEIEDGDTARRAQEVLDEIRRRSGERTRPEVERDYLERLIDRF